MVHLFPSQNGFINLFTSISVSPLKHLNVILLNSTTLKPITRCTFGLCQQRLALGTMISTKLSHSFSKYLLDLLKKLRKRERERDKEKEKERKTKREEKRQMERETERETNL